jgi:dephospho-CoA kinase
MLIAALTGGIASGKSVIAEEFRSRGAFVDRADEAARSLMAPGRPAYETVIARFGPAILGPDRSIDRKAFAALLFSDPSARAFVDGVVHPLVREERRRTVARLESGSGPRVYVAESALIFEAGAAGFFDRVVVADCPEDIRTDRLAARDGLGRAEALRRVRAQLSGEVKAKRADYIIDTSGSLEETLAGAARVFALLLEDAGRKERGEKLPRFSAR